MTTLFREMPSIAGPSGSVISSQDSGGLQLIHRANCAAAIWQRSLLPDLRSWIETLDPAHLPTGRLILQPDAVPSAVDQLLEIANTPASRERDLLIKDITILSELFCEIMAARFLRLRIDKITDNSCPKFHKDAVTARLLCAYRGRGTQFAFSGNMQETDQIQEVPTGSAILMRGTLWPEVPASGLLHRSPPIEGTGETRLLLVLDPVTDPDEAF